MHLDLSVAFYSKFSTTYARHTILHARMHFSVQLLHALQTRVITTVRRTIYDVESSSCIGNNIFLVIVAKELMITVRDKEIRKKN